MAYFKRIIPWYSLAQSNQHTSTGTRRLASKNTALCSRHKSFKRMITFEPVGYRTVLHPYSHPGGWHMGIQLPTVCIRKDLLIAPAGCHGLHGYRIRTDSSTRIVAALFAELDYHGIAGCGLLMLSALSANPMCRSSSRRLKASKFNPCTDSSRIIAV